MPSPVWKHFTKVNNTVVCNACGKLVNKNNTTNLWYHLEKYHARIYLSLKTSKTDETNASNLQGSRIDDDKKNDGQPTVNETSNSMNASQNINSDICQSNISNEAVPAATKPLVQTVFQNRFLKTTKAQAEKITMAIAYFIAVACLAYSIVENIGFRFLMSVLAPNYHVPSRHVFSDDRIPKLYKATKKKIIEEIKNIRFFGITTDGWTASNGHKFIALTLSFIDENWKLVCRTLACRDLNISNSGENIKCLIDSILQEYKIEKTQVTAATSDRGPNCVLAIEMSNFEHVPCFAHAVNTKMEEMLKLNFIAPTLSKIKGIYATLSRSKNAKNFLEQCQKDLSLPCLKMPSSCATRWWSETGQFKFTVANEMALYKYVTTYPDMDQSLVINRDDISRINAILLVMEPMERYVTTLGSETVVTASIVIPLIQKLDNIFKKFKFHDAVASYGIRKFFVEVPKFFNKLYVHEKSLVEVATYLDPRFKDARRNDLEVILKSELNEIIKNKPTQDPNASQVIENDKTKKKKSALEELFEDTGDDSENNIVDVATHELDLYHSQLKIPITENPLIWWKNRETVFPNLSVLAKKYLCVSATSVLSERVFSRGGRVITPDRSRITDQHAEELIFLYMNKDCVPKNV